MFNMLMSEPMSFIGVIGSFENIKNYDIYIRYFDFYEIFFNTFDIGKAYVALQMANPDLESKYRYIPADELFFKNYQDYLKNNCTKDALKKRAKDSIRDVRCVNRKERRAKEKDFVMAEKRNRAKLFREHAAIFFMTDEFPDNKVRFNVPANYEELKQRYNNLVLL